MFWVGAAVGIAALFGSGQPMMRRRHEDEIIDYLSSRVSGDFQEYFIRASQYEDIEHAQLIIQFDFRADRHYRIAINLENRRGDFRAYLDYLYRRMHAEMLPFFREWRAQQEQRIRMRHQEYLVDWDRVSEVRHRPAEPVGDGFTNDTQALQALFDPGINLGQIDSRQWEDFRNRVYVTIGIDERKYANADKKAQELFKATAGEEAFEQLNTHRQLEITGSLGTKYILHKRPTFSISRVEDQKELCAVVPNVPLWDHLLGIKLMIENDEPEFLRVANVRAPICYDIYNRPVSPIINMAMAT